MSFDILAPHYRWMEWLLAGGKLQRCRTAFLGTIAPPSTVLIYGEGNGRFLSELCRRFPQAQITCVDASAAMIGKARQRLQRNGLATSSIQFIHADVLQWQPPAATFDLVVTHFFLDCFREDQLRDLIPKIATAAKPQATWLLADFKAVEGGLRGWRSFVILGVMYLFFRWVTRLPAVHLTPPDAMLATAGFRLRERLEIDWGMLHSDEWVRE
ncbi:MAG: Methyltransferase type 12 [Verrucomicrobiaceae bacterium]|nr:Methyltransferase type 12 [Verrucomicrobiaceae bacterium]